MSQDEDVEMFPITTAVDQVAGSLRQIREDFEYDDGDVHMESVFGADQDDFYQTSQPIRLLIIDTNILISHLSLIEWLGELLMAERKLRKEAPYRCGLVIPKMVRAELDKHKMPHNKQKMLTALLEPSPTDSNHRLKQTSIHSPEAKILGKKNLPNVNQAIQISLYEAADQAINWMSRLFRRISPECPVIKLQSKNEVADPNSLNSSNSSGLRVSPDMHILDCVTYFNNQVQAQGGGVVLLTNDKALSLEAELEGLSTMRVQPGLSAYSLLNLFDSTLTTEIEKLVAQVSLKDMLTANWYRKTSTLKSKPFSVESLADEMITGSNFANSAHGSASAVRKDSTLLSSDSLECSKPTHEAEELVDESSTHMAIETDEDMSTPQPDIDIPFPPIIYQYMLTPSSLPIPRLLHFHYHLQQALRALLRQRLSEFLFRKIARNDLSVFIQNVTVVFERRKMHSWTQSSLDPNQWTAVDCLMLIDELWNEATHTLFEDGIGQSLPQALDSSLDDPQSTTKKTLKSRWAPRAPFMNSDRDEQNCSPFSNRLGRVRKAVQVLMTQLAPFNPSNLPRDNPLSWSVLFWEGLIEDIHKVTYYGRFYESFGQLEDGVESKDHLLQKLINNWKTSVRSLCEFR